ncbi:hypothetical protein DSO57_1027979 [Entomophthora muscae]|uniref:Uncharacterized protein n=1 Tax=Entomophthora muscae TaxID=34485 RepID=A0ACC2RGB4_9FUNG|nr:hypothetical protein DSO57_1027979 [Entomophthora muscae]
MANPKSFFCFSPLGALRAVAVSQFASSYVAVALLSSFCDDAVFILLAFIVAALKMCFLWDSFQDSPKYALLVVGIFFKELLFFIVSLLLAGMVFLYSRYFYCPNNVESYQEWYCYPELPVFATAFFAFAIVACCFLISLGIFIFKNVVSLEQLKQDMKKLQLSLDEKLKPKLLV